MPPVHAIMKQFQSLLIFFISFLFFQNGVTHRDLKLENILLDEDNQPKVNNTKHILVFNGLILICDPTGCQ